MPKKIKNGTEEVHKDLLQAYVPGVAVSLDNSCNRSSPPRLFHYQNYQSLQVDLQAFTPSPWSTEGSPICSVITAGRLEEYRRRNRMKVVFHLILFITATWLCAVHSTTETEDQRNNGNLTNSSNSDVNDKYDVTKSWIQNEETIGNNFALRDDDDRRQRILMALKNLDEDMQGDVVLVSNKPKFQTAANIWRQGLVHPPEAMAPLAVVEVSSVQDVALALPILAGLSKEYGMAFCIKSGGHSFDGASTVQGGVMLSLAKLDNIKLSWDPEQQDDDDDIVAHEKKSHVEYQVGGRFRKFGKINIDMNQQHVEGTQKTVTVQPGVKMEDFLSTVLDQYGHESVVSSAAGVAFGGFLLGGGYGYSSRMHGLGMDQVVRVGVVLVNGTVVDVYPTDQQKESDDVSDLFWALLGAGGGNFAVAVEYEIKVYPSRDMKLGAKLKMPISKLGQFLQRLGEKEPQLDSKFIASVQKLDLLGGGRSSPDHYTHPFEFDLLNLNSKVNDYRLISRLGRVENNDNDDQNNGTATVTLHWMGDSDGGSSDDEVGMDYINKNIMTLIPKMERNDVSLSYYYFSWSGITRQKEQSETWKTVWAAQAWNGFLMPANNTLAVWESIYRDMMTMLEYCTFLVPNIELWGGAISQRIDNATAFAHRSAVYNVGVRLLVPNGTEEEDHIFQDQAELVSAVWPSIARHLQGVYVNYPMPSLTKDDYPNAYWGKNLERLIRTKESFDPDNYLHHPHSVPAAKQRF